MKTRRGWSFSLMLLVSTAATSVPPVQQPVPDVTAPGPAISLGLPGDVADAAAILQAEDTRTVTASLQALSRDERLPVRARSAFAIGRIGLPSGQPRLLEMSRDPDPTVRSLAAFGLGKLEYDLAPSMQEAQRQRSEQALVARLADVPDVAANAALALGLIGAGRPALDAWLRRVGSLRPDARPPARVVIAVLGAWWRQPGATPEPLAPFVGAADVAVRRAAAFALGQLSDPNSWPRLLPLLDDADSLVRVHALRGLRGAPASLAEQRGTPLLRARDWREQCAALAWIGAGWGVRGSDPGSAFPEVLRRSLDRNLRVRSCALEALAVTSDRRAVAGDRLLEALGEQEASVRGTAMHLLAGARDSLVREGAKRIRPRFETAVRVGLPLTPAELRPAVELLAASNQKEDRELLQAALDVDDQALKAAALDAWQRLDPESAWAVARGWLDTMAPALIDAAVNAIDAIVRRGQGPAQADTVTEPLWRLFYDSSGPQMAAVRRDLLATLVRLDKGLMRRRWSLLAEQSDRNLRVQAFRLLAKTGTGDPPLPGEIDLRGHDTGRSLQQYEQLAAEVLALEASPPHVALSKGKGTATLELRADWAPLTVLGFRSLLQQGFYQGTHFQRLDSELMVRVGKRESPPWYAPILRSEETPIGFATGSVGLRVSSARDTGGGSFFITRGPAPELTGLAPIFGVVVKGQRVVDGIEPGDPVTLEPVPR